MLSRTVALPIIVGATILKGVRLRRRGPRPGCGARSRRRRGLVRLDARLPAPDRARRARPRAVALRRLPDRPRHGPGGSSRPVADVESRPVSRPRKPMSDDAYAAPASSQGAADAAVDALLESLRPIDRGASRARRSAAGPLRERAAARRAPRAGAVHRRRRDEAADRRAARALGHGRHRLRRDERQRRDLRRRRADRDARLPRRRAPTRTCCARSARACARGAELAGIEIPGGELAQLGEIVRGFDLVGACFGLVDARRGRHGSAIEPGDAVIGLPSSGLHSNGYTLARRALDGIPLDDERLGRPLGERAARADRDLRRAVLELLRSAVEVRGLAHITSGGLGNLLRLARRVGYEIDDPLPVAAGLRADRASRPGSRDGDARGLQHGLRLLLRGRRRRRRRRRSTLLRGHYPERAAGSAPRSSGAAASCGGLRLRGRRASPAHEDRDPDLREADRARRDRALRGAASVPGLEVSSSPPRAGRSATDSGAARARAPTTALDEVTEPDIVLVPGGDGNRPLLEDERVLDWLREVDEQHDVDDLGLHRLARARRRRPARRQARDRPLALPGAAARARRRAGRRARRRGRQGDHRRRRLGRDRHGARPGRPRDRGRGGRAGDPAGDRVRPAAAVRRRLAGQGAGADSRADPQHRARAAGALLPVRGPRPARIR